MVYITINKLGYSTHADTISVARELAAFPSDEVRRMSDVAYETMEDKGDLAELMDRSTPWPEEELMARRFREELKLELERLSLSQVLNAHK